MSFHSHHQKYFRVHSYGKLSSRWAWRRTTLLPFQSPALERCSSVAINPHGQFLQPARSLHPLAGSRARGSPGPRLQGSPWGAGAAGSSGRAAARACRCGGQAAGPAPRGTPASQLPAPLQLSAPCAGDLVTPTLCASRLGWGALTRCAFSSAPGSLACCTARTWRQGAGRPQGSPLSSPCARDGSPRTASAAALP